MDDKVRKILERPFGTDVLKQRQGPNGKMLTYVEIQHYVDRLNEAFTGAWSWEVTRREQVDEQILVEGRLTASGIVKTGLGGATITRRRDDNRPVSLADDTKKAEADAIKRACRLLGIGGHLYASDGDDEGADSPAPQQPVRAPSRPVAPPAPAPQPARAVAPQAGAAAPQARAPVERNRLTSKQLNALWAIAKGRGHDDRSFRAQVVQTFGAQPEYLTRQQASQLISSMTANGHDRQPGQEG